VRRVGRVLPVCLLALPLALAGCGADSGGGSDAGPIKVGLTVSLTGNYQALGTGDQQGALLAVDEINAAGGINGRKIEMTVKDDKTQPDQSVLAFNQHRGDDVVAVIGSSFSASALATIPQAERNKMPYVSLAPADEQVEPVKPYAFQIPAKSSTYAERTLQYLQGTGVSKIALAHDTKSAYAVAGYKAVKELGSKYGVAVVADQSFDTATQNFSPVFEPVRSSGAQALFAWMTGPPAIIMTQQYAASGLSIPLMLTGAQGTQLYAKPAGKAAENVQLTSSIGVIGASLPDSDLKKAVDKFATAYQQKYNDYPPQFAFDGYTGVMVLAEAIRKAGGTDAEKIREALEGLSLLTPNGRYNYSKEDHSGLAPNNIAVVVIKNGKFTPVSWMTQQLQSSLPK
jgi:branched-chain amino acid transport system substrate-binding protein